MIPGHHSAVGYMIANRLPVIDIMGRQSQKIVILISRVLEYPVRAQHDLHSDDGGGAQPDS